MQTFEHSFWHNLDSVIDSSKAALAIGNKKNATDELYDLSLNGHHGKIYGAMPEMGYFPYRKFDSDYIDVGDIGNIKSVELLINPATTTEYLTDLNATATIDALSGTIRANNFTSPTIYVDGVESSTIVANKWQHVIITTGTNIAASAVFIGKIASNYLEGVIAYALTSSNVLSDKVNRFNTLAKLPLYHHKFTGYPNNSTSLTSELPYSTGRITSGTFNKTDGLKCTSTGVMTFRNNWDFDGSEYITLTIDGIEYSGTGNVTHGTVTVSITQGSNLITVNMSTDDAIEELYIQFRKEV